ncbi:MAG: MBL fold metallo-hydrolase [Candidatus Bathyarchaeia archaeon]
MLIIPLTVGLLSTNCYIVACERTCKALIIDPGFDEVEAPWILKEIDEHNLRIKYVLNTHGHMDHISGNTLVKETLRAKIIIHQSDACMLTDPLKNLSMLLGRAVISPPPDLTIQNGEILRIGFLKFKVIHTPGHTPGSISLYCEDERVVFTGDTLFARSIGRTDLPGGSYETLISTIRGRLFNLPDETAVYPGHGDRTTIGIERKWNPFLR